ncbi:MAG: 50S ribosomal protein L19 [Planctomycetota bacterium]
MKSQLLESVEQSHIKKDKPYFEIGDIVDVHYKIKEGNKERVQIFSGTVIGRKGRGINENFTVRRIVNEEGVERIFPLNSPNIVKIEARQSGKVRRAKLYFLRKRTGKSVRLSQRHSKHTV